MNTHTTRTVHHWSHILRFFAPGPFALGMPVCIHPSLFRAVAAEREER